MSSTVQSQGENFNGDDEKIVVDAEEALVVQRALDLQAQLLDSLGEHAKADRVRQRVPNTIDVHRKNNTTH